MKHKYSVNILWSPADDAFVAQVMELPGCCADGATQAEALENLEVIIDEWIETAKELGQEIPDPLDCIQIERVREEFDAWVKQQVSREVETAVKRILEDLARNQPPPMVIMGNVAMHSSEVRISSVGTVRGGYVVGQTRTNELA